jgi:hypothetical protein
MKRYLLVFLLMLMLTLSTVAYGADVKITELPSATSPSATDIVPIVTDMGTTPVTKQISIGNLFGSPGPIGATTPAAAEHTTVGVSNGIVEKVNDLGTCTTAKTVVAATSGDQKMTLTAGDTCLLLFTKPSYACTASGVPFPCCTASQAGATCVARVRIEITQASTPTGAIGNGTAGSQNLAPIWPGAVVPTITTTNGAVDVISCRVTDTKAECAPTPDFR